LNSADIADKLTRVAKQEVGTANEQKFKMARPEANQGSKTKVKAQFDDSEIKDALLKVFKGEHLWYYYRPYFCNLV
jgi:hypothetical protein